MNFFAQFRQIPIGTKFCMFDTKIIYQKIGVKTAQAINAAELGKFEISEITIGIIITI